MNMLMKFLLMASLFIFAGCAFNVPLNMKLPLVESAIENNKKILLVMNKEFSDLTVTINRGGPFLDDPIFDAGATIKSNLIYNMTILFGKCDFSNDFPSEKNEYDFFLVPKILDQKITIGMTHWDNHEVYLSMEYNFFDSEKNLLIHFESKSKSSDTPTAGETALTMLFPVIMGQSQFKETLGRAWDKSFAINLSKFVSYLKTNLQLRNPDKLATNQRLGLFLGQRIGGPHQKASDRVALIG